MNQKLIQAFTRIDDANAADPNLENGQPVELLYGQRMTQEQVILYPDAAEPLQIACRGQHIERWTLSRKDFPDGRKGYLEWRVEQGRRHASVVAAIMADCGYNADDIAHAEKMLRKEGIKHDPDVQALEDVACFTFIRYYMIPFSETQTPENMKRIVAKTARKMSVMARVRAVEEFSISEPLVGYFRESF